MQYDFKFLQEVVWAALVAFVVYFLTAFTTTGLITDWHGWLIATIAGGLRAVAGVILAMLTQGTISKK